MFPPPSLLHVCRSGRCGALLNEVKGVVGKKGLMRSKLPIEDDTACAHNVKTKEYATRVNG